MITYVYSLKGSAADGQTWSVEGTISVDKQGQFLEAVDAAMREAFVKLTRGRAVYGEPGKGCNGPYRMTTLLFAEEAQ